MRRTLRTFVNSNSLALPEKYLRSASLGRVTKAASFGMNYLFERRSARLFLVNGSYHTLQFTLYGLILGLWH